MSQPGMTISLTAKGWIVARLQSALNPLAIHELNIPEYSENALATRMSELAEEGVVIGREREGKPYKEWRLTTAEERETLKREGLISTRKKRPKCLIGRLVGSPQVVAGQAMVLVAVSVKDWPKGAVRIEVPDTTEEGLYA